MKQIGTTKFEAVVDSPLDYNPDIYGEIKETYGKTSRRDTVELLTEYKIKIKFFL